MSIVNILDVAVLDNPTHFQNNFQFEIQFECVQPLEEDLEWKLLYVGNAEDSKYDQVLEEVMVGPVVQGIHKFVLQAPAPNPAKILNEDLIGVTVVLLTCSYMDQEFIRVGYYVNNEYSEAFEPENPPNPVDIKLLYRNILADQPRVTRFAINWSGAPLTTEVVAETGAAGATGVGSTEGNGDELIDVENAEMEDDDDEEDDEEDVDENGEYDIEAESDAECEDGEQQVMHYEDSVDVQQMQVFEGSLLSNN